MSGHSPADDTAALVPVKAFSRAKVRLAPDLSPAERETLSRRMATRVVAAARPLPVWVVCDDPDVAAWAGRVGASVCWKPGVGLNGAVTAGVAELASAGFARVLVAHSDLPFAASLAALAAKSGADGVTLVPDRRDDGTNVLVLPSASGFRFFYGPASFARHRDEAARLHLPVAVRRDPDLAWDVDVPDDLRSLLAVAPEWGPRRG